jgi:hypothetical protein
MEVNHVYPTTWKITDGPGRAVHTYHPDIKNLLFFQEISRKRFEEKLAIKDVCTNAVDSRH